MSLASVVKALEQREALRDRVLRQLFDKQLAIYESPSKLMAIHWGRRAGKTYMIPRFAILGLLDAKYGQSVVLVAESKLKAKQLFFADCMMLLKELKLDDWKVNQAEGTITTPWGSTLITHGAGDLGSVQLLRGLAVSLAIADECASWSHLLKSFVYDVIQPALGDADGRLLLFGTPSLTRIGHFFEICEGLLPGFDLSHAHGDVRENEGFPRSPQKFLDEVLERNGWDWNHPTFQREYLGKFVQDLSATVYRGFDPRRNLVDKMPEHYDRQEWVHTVGIDYGLRSECGFSVLASHPHEKEIYVVHSFKAADMMPEQASDVTRRLVEAYSPDVLVGDSGGLGVSYVEHYNRRFDVGLKIQPALKTDRRGMIDLLNDALACGRMRLVDSETKPLQEEMLTLPWAEDRLKEDRMYANHACDSVLYGFRFHESFCHSLPARRQQDVQSNPDNDDVFDLKMARREVAEDVREFWEDDDG